MQQPFGKQEYEKGVVGIVAGLAVKITTLAVAAIVVTLEVTYYLLHTWQPGVLPHLVGVTLAVVLSAVAVVLHRPRNETVEKTRSARTAKTALLILMCLGLCAGAWLGFVSWMDATNHKAFLNTAWGMSPEQVEEATRFRLEPRKGGRSLGYETASTIAEVMVLGFVPDSEDTGNKFQTLAQYSRYTLCGSTANVEYTFLNRKLYSYTLRFSVSRLRDLQPVRAQLRQRFGDPGPVSARAAEEALEWTTARQRVRMFVLHNRSHGYDVGIWAVYLPLESPTRRTIKTETEHLF